MFEMILEMLYDVVWPIKGIIYMEEQVLQWGLAWVLYNAEGLGVIVIILFGIGMMLSSYNLGRYFRNVRGFGMRLLLGLFATVLNILLAWFFLIWGALRGTMANTERTNMHRMEVHGRHMHHRVIFGQSSLHYRMGRGLYRLIYTYIFRFIRNANVRMILSRALALLIIVWGAWNIPYDLTH